LTLFVYKCPKCLEVVCCESTAEEMERKKKEHNNICLAKKVNVVKENANMKVKVSDGLKEDEAYLVTPPDERGQRDAVKIVNLGKSKKAELRQKRKRQLK